MIFCFYQLQTSSASQISKANPTKHALHRADLRCQMCYLTLSLDLLMRSALWVTWKKTCCEQGKSDSGDRGMRWKKFTTDFKFNSLKSAWLKLKSCLIQTPFKFNELGIGFKSKPSSWTAELAELNSISVHNEFIRPNHFRFQFTISRSLKVSSNWHSISTA